jgi:hypothetical protein
MSIHDGIVFYRPVFSEKMHVLTAKKLNFFMDGAKYIT